ncbi:hypothetical protein ACLQ2S_15585 [Micromonospora sp. DT48]|uniref:hypothetical protein n=1 Tax=unclassified Micromonospora TaxID=2617518 RepID=UPI0012BCBF6A|nr:hypothetical protein [Micromonospora sp. CP22]MTK04208.1 hypothetical protein [Micromonospora sp. CP22]
MNTDREAQLRAQLTRSTGPARLRPLTELSQILADRYWRIGPGQATALPALTEAIDCLTEAYDLFEAVDPLRAQVAAHLGWLLNTRHTVHGGPDTDRQTAIARLEEAVAAVGLPPVLTTIARFSLGQLYLHRLVRGLDGHGVGRLLSGAAPDPDGVAEAERAVDCFRQVIAADQMGAETREVSKVMLELAEAVRDLLSRSNQGATTAFDLTPIIQLMTKLQQMQQRTGGLLAEFSMPPLFDFSPPATVDPLDRPVVVVTVPDPAEDAVLPATPRPAVAPDPAALRRALRERVADDGDPYLALAALLRPDTPTPPGLVDDLVGLATAAVHAAGAAATAADRVALAVALYLRGTNDTDDGWGNGGDDLRSATALLLAAADALPAEPSGVDPIAVELAELLGEAVRDTVHARFAPVAEALRAVRVAALAWPRADDTLLLRTETGCFDRVPTGRDLPDRVVVVGTDPLAAGDAVVVSYVGTARQAAELATRVPMRVTEAPVIVADPRGGRVTAELDRLRRLYPRSVVLGGDGSGTDGTGTPDEVLAHLDASMLHLDCAIDTDGSLALAGPAELTPAMIAVRGGHARSEGGLAVLPPGGAGSGLLADALLTVGFTAVVDWVRPVPRTVATLMLTLLHTELVRGGLRPAAAVRAVGRRLQDPARIAPAQLPPALTAADLADPAYRTAMVLRGI